MDRCPTCGGVLTGASVERQGVPQSSPNAPRDTISPPPPYAQRPRGGYIPGVPPGYGVPPRPLEVRKIIATVVVVVAVIFIAFFMWLYVISEDHDHPEYLTANIETPDVQSREVGEELRWDVTLTIVWITPPGEIVPFEQVRVVIKSSEGVLLNEATPVERDVGVYDDGSDGTIDVEFWYVDNDAGNTHLSAGDTIRITGMTTAYEGAQVELVEHGERFGSILLPTDFP